MYIDSPHFYFLIPFRMKIELTDQEISLLKDLKEIIIDDDLLDLPAYDSISRSLKINNAWQALNVLGKIITSPTS